MFLFKITPDSREKFADCISLLEEQGISYYTQKQSNAIIFEYMAGFAPDFITKIFGDESCKFVGEDPYLVEVEVVESPEFMKHCQNLADQLQNKHPQIMNKELPLHHPGPGMIHMYVLKLAEGFRFVDGRNMADFSAPDSDVAFNEVVRVLGIKRDVYASQAGFSVEDFKNSGGLEVFVGLRKIFPI